MDISTALLLVTLLPTQLANSPVPDTTLRRPSQPELTEIAWSTPHPTAPPKLAAWRQRYQRQIDPVLSAWGRMLRRLQGDLPAMFDRQCRGLVSSLEGLGDSLLPAPDLLIDLYLRRLLLHLDAAALACSRGELYNVVYRLEEARSALGEVRWLLAQKVSE